MKEPLYIFSQSLLKKKDNSLLVETIADPPEGEEEEQKTGDEGYYLGADIDIPKGDKRIFPIEKVDSVFAFGPVRFNTAFLSMLAESSIPMHVFNFYGSYRGSYLPSKELRSGAILMCQIQHFADNYKRLYLAKTFVEGSAVNILANINYHKSRGAGLGAEAGAVEELTGLIERVSSIDELMGIEGTIRKIYFSGWKKIIGDKFAFTKRLRNPPPDPVNALISYGNMVVYSFCLNEIYHTRLYPEIGYLHSPGDNRLPLSYDLAEIFKPLVTDRAIFKLINKNMISEKDFTVKNGSCLIKKSARKIFVKELDRRISTVINNRSSGKNMSYRRIIRSDCHNLIRHLEGEAIYRPYRSRW